MGDKLLKRRLTVKGMTCISCEQRIEDALNKLTGVTQVCASYSKSEVSFFYNNEVIKLSKIIAAIERAGYEVEGKSKPPMKQKAAPENRINEILGVGIIILAALMVINWLGGFEVFNQFPQAQAGMGYGALFIIGLLTSVHCVAMCGGINLSQCAPQTGSGNGKKKADLRPSLYYNAGRVIAYTVIGGIVGALGSVISFSGFARGIVAIGAGVFMVIMGLNMLNLFPWLRRFNLRMPKQLTLKVEAHKKNKQPFYVGLLNGLMPCGSLQAMQLYALSTGDPWQGAISMFVFSLGTVPLLFGLGAISSFLSRKFSGKMMTGSAIMVIILGVLMFGNGLNLSGIALPIQTATTVQTLDQEEDSFKTQTSNSSNATPAVVSEGLQTVTTTLDRGRYAPIVVETGVPVRWTITADAKDINGCNYKMLIQSYGIEQELTAGENIVEFTPSESGTIVYSCWMGMISSTITVVDDLNR